MPEPFLSNRANASLISESACTCTRVSLHIRWSASHKYVPFLLRLRVCKEQSKCNSREIPNEQVLVESHTHIHTHIHTRTTRNTTDATVQDLEWSVIRVCVDDRKTYLQMCPCCMHACVDYLAHAPPPAPVAAAVHKKYSRFRDSAVDDASTFNWTQHTKTRSKLSHYSVLPLPYLTLPYPDLPSKA